MATATAHPNHQLISSEDVEGTEVYGVGDNHIGEVDHLMIDKVSAVSLTPLSASAAFSARSQPLPVPGAR